MVPFAVDLCSSKELCYLARAGPGIHHEIGEQWKELDRHANDVKQKDGWKDFLGSQRLCLEVGIKCERLPEQHIYKQAFSIT